MIEHTIELSSAEAVTVKSLSREHEPWVWLSVSTYLSDFDGRFPAEQARQLSTLLSDAVCEAEWAVVEGAAAESVTAMDAPEVEWLFRTREGRLAVDALAGELTGCEYHAVVEGRLHARFGPMIWLAVGEQLGRAGLFMTAAGARELAATLWLVADVASASSMLEKALFLARGALAGSTTAVQGTHRDA